MILEFCGRDKELMINPGLGVYRLAAKITGIALGRHGIVESVFANRGVGRGEITFGRSDIDLTMITRTPDSDSGDNVELFSLYRRVRMLRRLNPALTHIMVHDLPGFERWMQTDSYFGSQERRSMMLLAGKPMLTPAGPVRREDAARWVAFWSDRFFPMAVWQRNRRNLRKMCIEIWKAWAVARGIAVEPYLTLREAAQKAIEHPIGSALAEIEGDPRRAVGFVMKLAATLHDELFPSLKKLREPLVIEMLMPPRNRRRVLVVLPHPDAALPERAFEAQSLLATPELLHLYLHYFDPFLDWTLPSELRNLGFSVPDPYEFVRACLFFTQDNILRMPGFVRDDTWVPHAALAFSEYSVPYLRNGEVPPPMSEEAVRAALARFPPCSEYYLRDYPQLYRQSLEQWKNLEQLESLGVHPAGSFIPV